jgi:hypothetical protein
MTLVGRLVEVANDCFAVLQFQNLDLTDWLLWRSASDKNGSVELAGEWPL